MTQRLYYNDPNLYSFEAVIVSSSIIDDGRYVTILDKSAFYPTSGGQIHDLGEINSIAITEVVEEDETVLHYSDQSVGEAGEIVKGLIDKKRRQRHCQLHTSQHIISQALYRLENHTTVSVHLGENYGLVEIDNKTIADNILEQVEAMANQVVLDNLPITISFIDSANLDKVPLRKIPKRTGKIRIIQIGEFEYSACGGTHCTNTAGIGLIKLIGIEKVHGNVGIKFLCGHQAFDDYKNRFDIIDTLSRKFTCHVDDLPERINKLESDNKNFKKKITLLEKELLQIQAASLAAKKEAVDSAALVFETTEPLDPKTGGQLALAVSELIAGTVVLVGDERMIIVSQTIDASKAAKNLMGQFGLKGGGNNKMAQLSGVDKNDIAKYKEIIIELIRQ